jgi:hypothetical protein
MIGIVLSATVAFIGLQRVNTSFTPVNNSSVTITETPPLAYEGCAYTWANQDVPALTQKVDAAIKELNPDAHAMATLFGEDCIKADGTNSFGVMETDFSVHLPVDDLTAYEAFGNWIKQVFDIVLGFPREEIQGNYGFVEFWFEKNESEHIVFRVSIPAYMNDAKDKTSLELFNLYYQP